MTTTNKMETTIKKILASDSSKSSKMKELYAMNVPIKEIATLMEVRYNFVYNVISNHCNMNNLQIATTKKEGKKEKIIELYKEGKSNKEISIELKANSTYVFNVLKDYKSKNVSNDQVVSE